MTPDTPLIKAHPWYREYWELVTNCTNPTSNSHCPYNHLNLAGLPRVKVMHVVDGVYALAHALQSTLKRVGTNCGILSELKRVNFTNKHGLNIEFDIDGNPKFASFELVNLKLEGSNTSFQKAGFWSSKGRRLTLLADSVYFSNPNNASAVPEATCSEVCPPGSHAPLHGTKSCCWTCTPCPEGHIQPRQGQHICEKCTDGALPNKDQTACLLPDEMFFHIQSVPGIILMALTSLLLFCIFSAKLYMFQKRNTPVVMALNHDLSTLQFVSMIATLLVLPLLSNQRPSLIMCSALLFCFVAFYTVTLSVVFMKADRLYRIFQASLSNKYNPNSRLRNNSVQFLTILLLTCMGVMTCFIFYIVSTPSVTVTRKTDKTAVTAEYFCSGSFNTIMGVNLAYCFVIAVICGICAFRSRRLPQNYNEAKTTSFAMFAFCLIWTCACVVYLSVTSSIQKQSVLLYTSLLSMTLIFFATYSEKLYILIWRPDLNTKKYFGSKIWEKSRGNSRLTSISSINSRL